MDRSRLVLGTVQLGMEYGLNNTSGQPTKDVAFAILDTALQHEINTFDTAFAYGMAEDVLGGWIEERGVQNEVFVISKMKPHALNDYPDGTPVADIVLAEIEKSLKRLRLEKLDGYLLHTPSYVYLRHVVAGLEAAKAKGLVSHIGVSTYDEAEALQAAELGLDYVQVPLNALDQRIEKTDFWKIVERNGVTVFARSPFLQGLLVMEPGRIPAHLSFARSYVETFRAIADRHRMTPAQAALLYSYSHAKAHHIVFGVETEEQLNDNLRIVGEERHNDDLVREIAESFRTIERAVVNPSLWSTIK